MNNELVCHTGVMQFPIRKGWKRVHRLVVLPDYQGIGIGTNFITEIARLFYEDNWQFNLTTTTPAIVGALIKHKNWRLIRFGRNKSSYTNYEKRYKLESKHLNDSESNNRITYSFNYKK